MCNLLVVLIVIAMVGASFALKPCPGDTRGDRLCNHDRTDRVCAKIGVNVTSFWEFTEQQSFCETVGHYGGEYGDLPRCPLDKPTWCICKWNTARWIAAKGCGDTIDFDCEATDMCNVKSTYLNYEQNADLKPAHDCMLSRCKVEWDKCPE